MFPLDGGSDGGSDDDGDDGGKDGGWDIEDFGEPARQEPEVYGECKLPVTPARDMDVTRSSGLRFGNCGNFQKVPVPLIAERSLEYGGGEVKANCRSVITFSSKDAYSR